MEGTRMNMASSPRVAKFVAAILAMLAIAGCAKQVGETALASAAIPDSQQDLSVNAGDRVFFDTDSSELSDQARAPLDNAAILARSRAVMAA
jgi:peptidoglycan-associated lipoprotein